MKYSYLFYCLLLQSLLIAQEQPLPLDSIPLSVDLDDIVVTAQYAPTHIKNAVHQVRIIKAEDIKQQGQINLAEVLANQLNLNVSVDPILGNGLNIQGIGGENVQILIDGVPVIGRSNGNVDLSQINLQDAQRIEIIEGALSAQYGSNAAGGVVNIVTKQSQLGKWRVNSSHQYEDIGIWNNDLSIGFQSPKWYAAVGANRYAAQFVPVDSLRLLQTLETADGASFNTKVYPWNPKTQLGANAKLRFQPSDSLKLTYQFRYFDEDLSLYGVVRRPKFNPYSFDDHFNTQRTDHSLHIETYIAKHLYIRSTTAYNVYDRLSYTERIDLTTDTLVEIVAPESDTSQFTNFLHRTTFNLVGNGLFSAQLGLEAQHETTQGARILDSTAVAPNSAALTNFAAWVSAQYQPSAQLTVQTNLRYGYNSKYDHPLVPSINLNWQLHPRWNLKLNYARGFRAPSLKELYFNFVDTNHFIIGNPNLSAERSHNAAAILTTQLPLSDTSLELSAKLFYNYIQDRITLSTFESFKFNYQNLAVFETHGLNLRASVPLYRHLSLQLGGALTRVSNLISDNSEASRFSTLLESQAELRYRIPRIQTSIVLTHRYIGRQILFTEDSEGLVNESFVGGYQLFNLSATKEMWKNRWSLTVGAKNLLDIQTLPTSGGGGGAHGSIGDQQLFSWGRVLFVRMNVNITGSRGI